MGRYNVKSKQDLSGISTLTDNPIAVDNIRAAVLKNAVKHSIDADCKMKITKPQ